VTDEHLVRLGPPAAGDETATLLGSLERQRATFAWKVGGLDRDGLTTTVAASAITLGGLVKHLAFVEELKFSTMLHGRPPGPPWDTVDWDADGDWPWHSAAHDSPEDLYRLWHDAVVRSRAAVAEALANGGLDRRVRWMTDDADEPVSLRRLLVDVVEEYARHAGHADLIRERIDGATGA
jgi:uncharacterized damage-inducible protein DinB